MTEEFKMRLPGKTYKVGRFFHLYKTNGLFWFRFWNDYGIQGKNFTQHPLLFSERNNLRKRLVIGNWSFRVLKPNQI